MTIRCDELENYVIHVIWPVSVVFVHVKDNEIVHDHGGLKALKFVTCPIILTFQMTIRCEKLARDESALQNLSIESVVWNSWEPPSQADYIIKTQVKIHSSLRILSCHSCAGLKHQGTSFYS